MDQTYLTNNIDWNNIFNNHKEKYKYINKILINCIINNHKQKVLMFKIKIVQFWDKIKIKNKKTYNKKMKSLNKNLIIK